ncbi:MAG TPA: FAD-dependent oxidoreductase [Acidimicrobiia bacterium]|nr:FAD-dependent oxidoreductase [Acidimicrobiia bacterium]
MLTSRPEWDDVVDVVVLGSGAAALVAATLAHDGGASVAVLEKADLIGGTTGVSGGMPWIPMNRHMAEVGVDDSRDEALAYIRRLTLGREPDPDLVEVYVDTAPEMLDYLEAKTPLRMTAPPAFNDYYAHLPGGKPAGRSIEPVPFDARSELGPEQASRVRTSPHLPWLTMDEGAKFLRGDGPPDVALAQRRQADDVRVLGSALVASLFKGLLDRGVDVTTAVAARELVVVDGEVVGVRVEDVASGGSRCVGARKGVVLACGGFEWNDEMVRAFVGQDLEPMGPPHNEGDGLRMAMEAGARLANMGSFWGQPAISEPGFELDGRPVPQMASVRSIPGVIVVNRHGRRFVNEGATYQDFPKVNTTFDPVAIDYPNEAPQWIVFDQRVKDSAVVLPTVLPGQAAPAWITQAPTLRELASAMGVDGDAFEQTVAEWNDAVGRGEDARFGRGTTKFEVHMSGRDPSPRICMAPLGQPPFYAIPLRNGTLGTNGGPLVDRHARVRRFGGGVVPGLYAAGNVAASVFGPAYPGGGATIGPAMTFGYLAGRHVAQQPGREI